MTHCVVILHAGLGDLFFLSEHFEFKRWICIQHYINIQYKLFLFPAVFEYKTDPCSRLHVCFPRAENVFESHHHDI